MNTLHDVLVDMIKDIYHAEKQLVRALPKMIRAAASTDLRSAFEEHLEVTRGQVERLEHVFSALDVPAKAKVCHGMLGIVEEGSEVLDEDGANPAARDAALIAAAQKVEHYEIASYGTARAFAETLELDQVAELLAESLSEEEEADKALSGLAESINEMAARNAESDEIAAPAASSRAAGSRRRTKSR